MKIQKSPQPPVPPPRPPGEEGWWHHVGLGTLPEKLGITPERIDATVESSRNLGKSLAMSWPNLRETVEKVLGHPVVGSTVGEAGRNTLEGGFMVGAATLGYGVAGIEGLAGVAKLVQGVRRGSPARILEGMLDLTAGVAIAATLVGTGSLPIYVGTVAAGLGVARGGVHMVKAYQKADSAKEVQGLLDATRSAAVMTALQASRPLAGLAAAVLGPVVALVQACRGYVHLRQGLESKDKSAQLSGLSDIATSAGLVLSFSGLPVVGIGLMVASSGVELLHKVLPLATRLIDRGLGGVEPGLGRAVTVIERTVDPVFQKVRKWIDEHSPWQHGEDK